MRCFTMKKFLLLFICVCLIFPFHISVAYAENKEISISLVDTQKFIDAVKPYYNHHYYYKTNPELTLENVRKSGIRFFEENDKRVVFGLVSSINAALHSDGYYAEKIGDYEFLSSGYFSEDNKNICGYFVYQDGKLYTLAEAVEQGVVDVNEMAKIIPNTKKSDNINPTEPAAPPAVTEPAQPTAPAPSTPKVTSKKANTIKVTAKTKTVKAKKLKKKAQTVKAITVKNAQGKVSYKLVKSGITKKIQKIVSINSKGVITIKKWKNAKKGTYNIKVSVTAKGNTNYKAKTVTKTVKVKVK